MGAGYSRCYAFRLRHLWEGASQRSKKKPVVGASRSLLDPAGSETFDAPHMLRQPTTNLQK
jgi:hypothetical protein